MRAVGFLLLVSVGCHSGGGPTEPSGPSEPMTPDKKAIFSPDGCVAKYEIHQRVTLLSVLRNAGIQADDFQKVIEAVPFDPARHVTLKPFADFTVGGQPTVFGDPEKKVGVVSATFFTDLATVDATTLRKGSTKVVGRALPPVIEALGPRRLAELLMHADVIRPYVHMNADVCLRTEIGTALPWQGEYDGVHHYYTNTDNHDPLAFAIQIAEDGTITALGRL
ncbi:MAG: hypothetical protein HOV80_02180 [Polyangiaceae bacterium]|nr:hypothetical protein [Polyangiaceae bacterium]